MEHNRWYKAVSRKNFVRNSLDGTSIHQFLKIGSIKKNSREFFLNKL